MDRRAFVTGSSAAALVLALPSATARAARAAVETTAKATAAGPGDAALNALFDRIMAGTLARSPELATSLGLDKGAQAGARRRLDNASEGEMRRNLAETKRWIAELEAIPVAGLSPAAALNRKIVLESQRRDTVAPERFGLDSVIRPYRIFQQGGAYYGIPDFLNDTHVIATKDDAEAYLARLEAFAVVLDQDTVVQRTRATRGIIAPDFALDLTLAQMQRLRATPPGDTTLVRSLADRARAKGIAGDWQARATRIVTGRIHPALDRQIALVRELRPQTRPGAGVWRLPEGEALYAAALAQATTTTLSPDEVHRMGLAQVAELSAELDRILKGQGLTKGSIAERLDALNRDPAQLYPDTAAGRAALIDSLNRGVQAMAAKLPRAFGHIPGAPLEIRAVPVEIQDGASNGYYKSAALDGSRPAIYFINLKEVADWPKYSLPSLTYHEALPGHHLQISIAQGSGDIPLLRKIGFYGAYLEGWALYAEQLSDELGGYATPLERAGYLQSFLFRAARLVVDTGIHTKRWDREKATDYMVETVGFVRPRSQREVERYCTQPGQACSYKVGHAAWLRARAGAEKTLGSRFDIKRFHDVLADGAMPLTLLEQVVAKRTAAQAG